MGRGILIAEPRTSIMTVGSGPSGPNYANAPRVMTPNPKEAFTFPASPDTYFIDLDFGAMVAVDTVFVGYHNAVATNQTVAVQALGNFMALPSLGVPIPPTPLPPLGYSPPSHTFAQAAAPLTARYWRVAITNNGDNPPLTIGVISLGLAFQTEYGEERGGGGIIEDTGSVERLFGGGFGIDEGVATTGYQWSFGDLQNAERRQLFQIVKRLRTTRSFLMVEEPSQTEGLNERIHWGMLRGLEVYERINPRDTKWSFKMHDWA